MSVRGELLAGTANVDPDAVDDSDAEYEEICGLFEAFHGYAPDEDSDDVIEHDDGRFLMLVGELTRIGYETKEADEQTGLRENLHTFGQDEKTGKRLKNDRPLLYVDVDGQIVVIQGDYTFTERGFEET